MEELLVITLGALAVVAAPLIPGVRSLAKSLVKGGMALSGAAATGAAAAGQQWDKMVSNKVEVDVPVVESTATVVADAAHATSEAAASVAETAKSTAAAAADTVSDAVSGAGAAVDEAAAVVIDGDDLTKISGIGPKTAGILAAAGITTYAQLAAATEAGLREILESAGPRYRLLDPTTWPDQAGKLLAEESIEESGE